MHLSLRVFFLCFTSLLVAAGTEPARAAGFQVTTVAGTGAKGFSRDGGAALTAPLNNPYGIVRGPDRALYICDMDNHRIRRISGDGTVTTVAGTGRRGYSGDGGLAVEADMNEPYEVRFDKDGHLFCVEMRNHIVRRIDMVTKRITTVAGTGQEGFSGDGGPATRATLKQPHSLQFDSQGSLYICDIGNHRLRKVDMQTGVISTFAGTGNRGATTNGALFASAPIDGPRAIDFDKSGRLWLALREGNAICKLDLKSGTIQRVAGTGQKGFSGNGGPATQATLSGPKGISIGPDGNVYFADTESHTIRMVDTAKGTVELVAGTGERGDGPDGAVSNCRLARPHGIFVDQDGAILVGDSENHRVRAVRGVP